LSNKYPKDSSKPDEISKWRRNIKAQLFDRCLDLRLDFRIPTRSKIRKRVTRESLKVIEEIARTEKNDDEDADAPSYESEQIELLRLKTMPSKQCARLAQQIHKEGPATTLP
jgi:fructose-1,6-bisphosphatase